MPVQSGRVVVDPTQGSLNATTRKEIQQIKRELVKIAPPVPVTAGVLSTGIARAASLAIDGFGRMSFTDWTFFDDEGDSLGLTASVSGFSFDVANPGIYIMSARMAFSASPVPTLGNLRCRFNIGAEHTYSAMTRTIIVPPSGDYIETHTLAPLPVRIASGANFSAGLERDTGSLPTFTDPSCDFYVVKLA